MVGRRARIYFLRQSLLNALHVVGNNLVEFPIELANFARDKAANRRKIILSPVADSFNQPFDSVGGIFLVARLVNFQIVRVSPRNFLLKLLYPIQNRRCRVAILNFVESLLRKIFLKNLFKAREVGLSREAAAVVVGQIFRVARVKPLNFFVARRQLKQCRNSADKKAVRLRLVENFFRQRLAQGSYSVGERFLFGGVELVDKILHEDKPPLIRQKIFAQELQIVFGQPALLNQINAGVRLLDDCFCLLQMSFGNAVESGRVHYHQRARHVQERHINFHAVNFPRHAIFCADRRRVVFKLVEILERQVFSRLHERDRRTSARVVFGNVYDFCQNGGGFLRGVAQNIFAEQGVYESRLARTEFTDDREAEEVIADSLLETFQLLRKALQ